VTITNDKVRTEARRAMTPSLEGLLATLAAGIELERPIPFGNAFALGSRLRFEYPGARFEPFAQMHLVDPEGPSFWIVEPGRLFDDYLVAIPEADVASLGLVDASDVLVFVIVAPGDPVPTVNLFAPIVVNRRSLVGAQVILEDSGYACAVPVDAGTARPRSTFAR
jgi:flagellar assembly factor FliW